MIRMAAGVAVLGLGFGLAPAAVRTQQQPATIGGSYQQARQLLDRAIEAHGGLEAMRRARRIRIEFAGHDVWRHQSRRPAPPYDRRPAGGELHIDLDAGKLAYELARSYTGNIHRHFRFATNPQRGYYVNHRHRTYTVEDYPPPDRQINNLYYVPQLILLGAHDSGMRLRSLGSLRLASGASVDAITTATANGSLTIGLDPATHRLRSLMVMRADAVAGTVAAEIEFHDYRDAGGVLTPGRRTVSVGGEVTEDFEYRRVSYGDSVPEALVTPPAGYELRSPQETPAVRALADNVWLVGGSAASLVVALGDEVMVIDAAPSSAAAVIAHVAKALPGKTIRYVVPTHHHDDHAAGIRAFAREGAAVLTSPGNQALFEQLAGQPVQIIAGGRRVFSFGDRSLEIHDVGPSPHADGMLIAWLPKEGILFEGDLIDATAPGSIEAGANNDTTMHLARWLDARGWQVRQFAGAHGAVIDAATFRRLLAQPATSNR
jgi:glyoxylase-like metal-dependent hydrolase (beta-lactamase superfamily II)